MQLGGARHPADTDLSAVLRLSHGNSSAREPDGGGGGGGVNDDRGGEGQ